MTSQEEKLQKLVAEFSRKERLARKRAWLYLIVPLVIGGAWLIFSYWQVTNLSREVTDLEKKRDSLLKQNERLQSQVFGINKEFGLRESHDTERPFSEDDKNRILNSVTDQRRRAALINAFALKEQNPPISFLWGGKSPNDGFDTSGYVAFVLSQVGVLKNPETYYSGRLFKEKTKETEKENLEAGDMIYHDPSQVFFYLDKNYCLGMTPQFGITVTQQCSGQVFTKYGKVDYK